MFTVYEAATGHIVATDKTETQALALAEALKVKGVYNVTLQCWRDVEGGNAFAAHVRHDQV